MLVLFFLRQFFKKFCLFFSILTLIFASSDLFMRLPLIASVKTVPLIFWTMLPMMTLFSLPISSCLAIQTSLGELMIEDELMMVRFLRPARIALHRAVGLFAIVMVALYALLIFEWAPQSYLRGKKLLVTVAKEHFYQLEPNKFHTPFAGVSCFFKRKVFDPVSNVPSFSQFFLSFNKKHGPVDTSKNESKHELLLFTAQYAILSDNKLLLKHGSVHTINKSKHYVATFDQTELSLQPFLTYEKLQAKLKHVKYATLEQLSSLYYVSPEAAFELHKRIAQILWQFIFPFLALFGIFLLGRKKSNLLLGVVFSGLLYFISYVFCAVAQGFLQHFFVAVLLLYLPIILLFLIAWCLYKRFA
jgi:lipopolysaccharide export LptBFGC system permease protein LptF